MAAHEIRPLSEYFDPSSPMPFWDYPPGDGWVLWSLRRPPLGKLVEFWMPGMDVPVFIKVQEYGSGSTQERYWRV